MIKHAKPILLPALLLLCAAVFIVAVNADFQNIDNIQKTLAKFGAASPIIFILLCSIRSFMLLPCGIFSAVGGILFGPIAGTVLTLVGFTFNALVLYYMSRYLGRGWVKRVLKERSDYLDNYIGKNSFFSILLLRIIPLLPFDAVSCIAGVSKAKLGHYLAATVLGSIPGTFIYTYFGDSLTSFSIKRIIIPSLIILLMTFVPLVYKLVKHRYSIRKINDKDSRTTI